ncbi:MAG: type II toxin-antitoxin system VapC family toxin [Trueperaceae bacterium]|nr:MAG: type II toxin-antitoxin system VapC family toxin [Trueperaceae bacterium]
MIYLDTSFLIPYYLEEPSSRAVETALKNAPVGRLCLSVWTQTEFASTLARALRLKLLSEQAVSALVEALEMDIEKAFTLLPLGAYEFELASRLLLAHPSLELRTSDALHLAVAKRHGAEIYSLDRKLIQAAHALGIPASDGGLN